MLRIAGLDAAPGGLKRRPRNDGRSLVQVVPALIEFLQFGPKDRGVRDSNALRGAKTLRVIIEGPIGVTSVAMPAVSLVGIEKSIQAGTDGDDDGEHASDDGRVGERGNSRASRTHRLRHADPKMADAPAASRPPSGLWPPARGRRPTPSRSCGRMDFIGTMVVVPPSSLYRASCRCYAP